MNKRCNIIQKLLHQKWIPKRKFLTLKIKVVMKMKYYKKRKSNNKLKYKWMKKIF